MNFPSLFSPLQLGAYRLRNRVILAPLTRMRAGPGNVPHELNARYYAQRAGAGLVIAEATQVAADGQGYPNTPGIHSPEQTAGWRLVTDAVHKAGGVIFLQLWHVGRISHPSMQPGGAPPIAPSAVTPRGKALTPQGPVPFEAPRALELGEIPGVIERFRHGAMNALAAGFDGVEIHGANGYLIEQFTNDRTNLRTDAYGGSPANRSRLLFEIADAVVGVWGRDRVGLRLSPFGGANDSFDSDPLGTYGAIVRRLSGLGLAYLHLIEPRASGAGGSDRIREDAPFAAALFRPMYSGVLIAAGGFTRQSAMDTVSRGIADAVAFGRIFLANPDLPRRLEADAPLNPYDRSTFYGGGARGYTDYPSLGERAAE